jgi:hypothetical protein
MEKEIQFSEHALSKIQVLEELGISLTTEFIVDVLRSPDRVETDDDKSVAQKQFDDRRVLRVVYREFEAFILVITLYPGRRSRYAKDSL